MRLLATFLLIHTLAYASGALAQEEQFIRTAQNFCHLDAAGRRLNPVGAKEIAKILLREDPWQQQTAVIVISDYSVRTLTQRKDTATLVVDYRVLGHLDSSFNFTRMQVPYTNQPLTQSEHLSLILSDTHFELGTDGGSRAVKGVPEWRIKSAPKVPHVTLAAAIEYLYVAVHRSKTPALKMKAAETLRSLERLTAMQSTPSGSDRPEAIFSQYIAMQVDGMAFTPEGSSLLSMFFFHAPQWRRDKIGVARSYKVQSGANSASKADAWVEYVALGELDAQLRFVPGDKNENIVRQDYKLVYDDKYSLPSRSNSPGTEFTGAMRWRVEEAPTEQWITVDAAIRHITEIRATTTDQVVRANADKALAVLANSR
jgi:hypothetical protein